MQWKQSGGWDGYREIVNWQYFSHSSTLDNIPSYFDMDKNHFFYSFKIPVGEKHIYWNISSKYKGLSQNDFMNDYELTSLDRKTLIWSEKKQDMMINLTNWKKHIIFLTEELIATAMHPRRLIRHLEMGGDIEDF